MFEYEQEMDKLINTERHGLGRPTLLDIWHEIAQKFSPGARKCLSHYGQVWALEVGLREVSRSLKVTYGLLYWYLLENSVPTRTPWVDTVEDPVKRGDCFEMTMGIVWIRNSIEKKERWAIVTKVSVRC